MYIFKRVDSVSYLEIVIRMNSSKFHANILSEHNENLRTVSKLAHTKMLVNGYSLRRACSYRISQFFSQNRGSKYGGVHSDHSMNLK